MESKEDSLGKGSEGRAFHMVNPVPDTVLGTVSFSFIIIHDPMQ